MRLAVVGDPVAHSLSPALHRAALAAAGIPGSYTARRVDAAELAAVVHELRSGALDGVNVTMPHKAAAAALADDLTADAARAQAANTLLRVGDRIVGHNSDIPGIRAAWAAAGLERGAPALILGAGGAAAGALMALHEARSIHLSARNQERAEGLIARMGIEATVVPWGTPVAAVVVNSTPLGMRGEHLPPGILDQAQGLLDMTYADEPTPAVVVARNRGLPVATGHDMLLAQAAISFRLWTGRRPSLAAMRAAMDHEIARRRSVEKP